MTVSKVSRVLLFLICAVHVRRASLKKPRSDDIIYGVHSWSSEFSQNLYKFSKMMTRRDEVRASFENTRVEEKNGNELLEKITRKIRSMMEEKVDAVRRIKTHAEALSMNRKFPIETDSEYDYYDSNNMVNTSDGNEKLDDLAENFEIWKYDKPPNLDVPRVACPEFDSYFKLNKAHNAPSDAFVRRKPDYFRTLAMRYHHHFDDEVNLNYSAVKVATSIFNRDKTILNNIRWSEALDITFRCNFQMDPSLTWQYFASSSGFMRLYPAISWSQEEYDQTYDFRIRSWYTESMTSPKDIMILLDNSGSMKGRRRTISHHIVHTILDTISDNDYVNIYTFSNISKPLVECFNSTLVQANEENLRLLREGLALYNVTFPSNVNLGFTQAFDILEKHRRARNGSQCNQVIMVITEGMDYYDCDSDILKNRNRDSNGHAIVRIFTFLLSTEESDAVKMRTIACENMGYYVNVTLDNEVREKVVKYLEVLSRPINLKARFDESFQPVWSALYVDLADRRLTNWLWSKEEGIRQRNIFMEYTNASLKEKGMIFQTGKKHFVLNTEHSYEKYLTPKKYVYLSTVSLPVYDKRSNYTTLVGVAAVDVSIDYMKKLTLPHELGVNGYAFIITNNGYVLMHPDHRTNFRNILKPTFNRVDLTEVELSTDTKEPRQFDDGILELREKIINQTQGYRSLNVLTHLDDMMRIYLGRRHYFYAAIEPYSLVIALPGKYGLNKIKYGSYNFKSQNWKMSSNWKIHPDWLYYPKVQDDGLGPEEGLLKYLENCTQCKFHHTNTLLHSLLQDFNNTSWFERNVNFTFPECWHDSVAVAFLATHSGLTRWKNINPQAKEFGQYKSIDEIWYKRAVEENFGDPIDQNKFIYSIPLNSKINENETLVTVSSAVFKSSKYPTAVVGFQMYYREFKMLFHNEQCNDAKARKPPQTYESWIYLVLDNHGYVIISDNDSHVGQLIRDVSRNVTQKLEDNGVYKAITLFDYQGICFPNAIVTSCPSSGDKKCRNTKDKKTLEYQKRAIQKTVPTPCDKEMLLYMLKKRKHNHFPEHESDCTCPYVVSHIENTNLVILAFKETCCVDNLNANVTHTYPKEKKYDVLLPCYIATKNNYYKRQYLKCIRSDQNEFSLNKKKEQYCGEDVKNYKDEF